MRIGLDFDNTIICYDDVFLQAAKERALVPEDFAGTKQDVRDKIRLLPDGELSWQKLQGYVYGRGIGGARAFDGLKPFLRRARAEAHEVVIVSHKTEYGHHDPERVSLRDAARDWMEAQGLFSDDAIGLDKGAVHFAATRDEKIAKIDALGCSVFVDDLIEVLSDPAFPDDVQRVLFSEKETMAAEVPYAVCANWAEVEEHVLGR